MQHLVVYCRTGNHFCTKQWFKRNCLVHNLVFRKRYQWINKPTDVIQWQNCDLNTKPSQHPTSGPKYDNIWTMSQGESPNFLLFQGQSIKLCLKQLLHRLICAATLVQSYLVVERQTATPKRISQNITDAIFKVVLQMEKFSYCFHSIYPYVSRKGRIEDDW